VFRPFVDQDRWRILDRGIVGYYYPRTSVFMLEKNPHKIAAMEKTRLHLQKSLVRVHARGTIFPVLNTDSVASRYPTEDHSERHVIPTINAIIHSILVFLVASPPSRR